LKKNFPDYVKGDYMPPKHSFPSPKMVKIKYNIDKIFNKDFSTLRYPSFPIEKSNKVELSDLKALYN